MSQSHPGADSGGFWMDLGRFLVEFILVTVAMSVAGGAAYLIAWAAS